MYIRNNCQVKVQVVQRECTTLQLEGRFYMTLGTDQYQIKILSLHLHCVVLKSSLILISDLLHPSTPAIRTGVHRWPDECIQAARGYQFNECTGRTRLNTPDSDKKRERIKAVEINFVNADIAVGPVNEMCAAFRMAPGKEWRVTTHPCGNSMIRKIERICDVVLHISRITIRHYRGEVI